MPLYIVREDITNMRCDAIVNTTNRDMVGYSGVDLSIHEGAGPRLDEECRSIAPLELGFAKITGAYDLPARYIIHTHGPVWRGGDLGERALLKSCYIESLELAVRYGCRSVAFPLISSGAYGYPKDRVLRYAVEVISEFLMRCEMQVFLCVYDRESYEFSRVLLDDIRSFIDSNSSAPCPEHAVFPICTKSMVVEPSENVTPDSLEEFLMDRGDGFSEVLFSFIDSKGISDVECYKRANIDKKIFSKIKCNKNYKPSKQTAVAFAIALELTLAQTQELLGSAGMALSHCSIFDLIVEYYILKGKYNIFEINEALFEFDQPLLGSI